MTREEIQNQAIISLRKYDYNGVLALNVGVGKSKIAIDAIKEANTSSILIVSPRTNLKENWKKELEKWGFELNERVYSNYYTTEYNEYFIEIENIQKAYKYTLEQLESYSLVIYDEIHTCGEEYFNLIRNAKQLHIPVIGLTGTPNKSDEFKRDILYKELPIIYEYLTAERDGIINKTQYWIYEYELNNEYKVITGTKDKKWEVGELQQYEYLERQYNLAKILMYNMGADNYFQQSLLWMRAGTPQQKEAGRKFFYAIKNRKEFLWNLNSSYHIALQIKNKILNANKNNKVLLFSELTSQANRLSPYNIHSNVGKTSKQSNELNKLTLQQFNDGEIRELSSVKSLQLGLNLNKANFAIFESYNGGDTGAKQSGGRLGRLDIESVANAIIITPKGTQADSWRMNAFSHIENPITINNINQFILKT